MIKPVQQVPRYRMLLEQLLENTEEDHVDYHNLVDAKEKINNAAQHANTSLKHREKEKRMISLVNRFADNTQLKWDTETLNKRRIIREGIILKQNRRGDFKPNVLVLFNDFMAYGKGKINGKIKHRIKEKRIMKMKVRQMLLVL